MKPLMTLVLLLFLLHTNSEAQSDGAIDTAYQVAHKIKESLSLDNNLTNRIFHTNIKIYLEKRNTPLGSPQQQYIEQYRDSAYKELMTDSSYKLYLQRKQSLLSGN